ncbi:HpsJ family protein [Aetokthonos hydrillicola Thurmond2011]|jgi:hypothetical protein|uniref:HpsJ family protein n=1 Tax=Aetokthonos hydrillicola Thurmond2011 TaxID=2712845 RepID=A0AAP5I8M8_9CYAN|nr:HpsJ family protein [Aetokthonos hydrillicola]MBW4587847.1 HpsJ family protein [Aetokthonos hydrillicola CCALA 1050]MDR9894495.1 HpsJ family protein [Aetokthonos hydrillicola Thurmond2011]
MNHRSAAGIKAARILTVSGFVLITSFFVDFLFLLFPFQVANNLWQIEVMTALVERGILPLVGFSLLFAGYWIDSQEEDSHPPIDLRFPAIILSGLLGLIFLLIFPIHLNNVRQGSLQAIEQINLQAQQQEIQLQNRLNQLKTQLSDEKTKEALEKQKSELKTRYTDILGDEQLYQNFLDDPTVSQPLKDLFKNFKANPQELDQYIEKQSDPQTFADQELSKIRQIKEVAEKQARDRAWKFGLRISISSSLLSMAFIIIAWTGWTKITKPDPISQPKIEESLATK